MMKIPGNNSNGTTEMWEKLACRGRWRGGGVGGTWAGCDFNSAPSPGIKVPATSFRTAAQSWLIYPTFSSAGFGELGLWGSSGFTGLEQASGSTCSYKSSRGPKAALASRESSNAASE